nr:hypothetical protein [Tanacetum cinerariifolium]
MIAEPGDGERDVNVNETFYEQTGDELSERELKQIEADDQAIQTILLSLPEDIYAAVDSCESAQEIWLRVQQMMKGSDIGIQEKKAKHMGGWGERVGTVPICAGTLYRAVREMVKMAGKTVKRFVKSPGSESRPPMLYKENYVPWSSRLLRYAKSRPNEKLIHNSILNGPYIKKIILEPGDANRDITVTETFHLKTYDELSDKELKEIEVDDQAIQNILLGLPEDIYATMDSCETAQEILLRVQKMMEGSDIGIQEKKAKLFNEWERFTSNEGGSIESYYHRFLKLMNDLKRNKHFPEKIASNLKFLNNLQPEWSRHVTIVHQTKDLHTADYTKLYDFLKYNQKEVAELKAERLAKTQDPLALMANSNNPYAFPAPHQDQSSFNQNYLQQPMPNPEDITDPTTAMNMALTLMAKAFKLNYSTPTNNNQRISSNPRNRQIAQPGMNMGQDRQMQMVGGHYARNCTVRPRKRDAAYLQTQLLIAQKEEAEIQLQAEEYDLMAAAADLDEIEKVNVNCILMANLQQASTSGTQTDNAPVYDTDGSAEVHEIYDDNEIFNMFIQEEQYTELLEPIPESHQVPQNDNDVISEDTSVEQGEETVEQNTLSVTDCSGNTCNTLS